MRLTGQQIYENFHSGMGSEGLQNASALIKPLVEEYKQLGKDITDIATALEAHWEGTAGYAAAHGAGPLAVEFIEASLPLSTAQDLIGKQAGLFTATKHNVVPVPDKPEAPGGWDMFFNGASVAMTGSQTSAATDYETALADHNDAARHNAEQMRLYTNDSRYNTENLPTSYGKLSADISDIDVERENKHSGGHAAGGGPTVPGGGPSGGGYGGGGSGRGGSGYAGGPPGTAIPSTSGPGVSGGNSAPPGESGDSSNAAVPGSPTTTTSAAASAPTTPAPGYGTGIPGSGYGTGFGTGGAPGGGHGTARFGESGMAAGGYGTGGYGSAGSSSGYRRAGSYRSGGTPEVTPGASARSGVSRATRAPAGAAADEAAMGRAGTGGRGMGGMRGTGGMGRGGKGRDDVDHETAGYLQEPDPDELFGGDIPPVAPPVIGE